MTVLSGFLGSGKTTLLRRALGAHDATGTAVIVNELGEVGLDQLQVSHVADRTVLLANGCLCCATREDVAETLRALLDAAEATGHPLDRVVLETSGLADPGARCWTPPRRPATRSSASCSRRRGSPTRARSSRPSAATACCGTASRSTGWWSPATPSTPRRTRRCRSGTRSWPPPTRSPSPRPTV
jgi:hypothetical protein